MRLSTHSDGLNKCKKKPKRSNEVNLAIEMILYFRCTVWLGLGGWGGCWCSVRWSLAQSDADILLSRMTGMTGQCPAPHCGPPTVGPLLWAPPLTHNVSKIHKYGTTLHFLHLSSMLRLGNRGEIQNTISNVKRRHLEKLCLLLKWFAQLGIFGPIWPIWI